MTSCITALPSCPEEVRQEIPGGATDCLNLSYTTANKFVIGSLRVFVDGVRDTATIDFTEGVDQKSFTHILGTLDKNRRDRAVGLNQDLRVEYTKAQSTDCITIL